MQETPKAAPFPPYPETSAPADVREWLWTFLETDPNIRESLGEVLEEALIRHHSAGQSNEAASREIPKIDSALHSFGEDELRPVEVLYRIEEMGPDTWGYPAENWDDVAQICELQDLGLSRMQAIVQVWKNKGLTHEEIAEKTGRKKATIDTHSRRIGEKVEKAEKLLNTVTR